jgi:Mg2+-importing ATPase
MTTTTIGQQTVPAYWSVSNSELLIQLGSNENGLSFAEVENRLEKYGPNELRQRQPFSRLRTLWNQLRSPLLLLLVFAAGASALSGEWIDATIVLSILAATVTIGYTREYSAAAAAAALRARIRTQAKVRGSVRYPLHHRRT